MFYGCSYRFNLDHFSRPFQAIQALRHASCVIMWALLSAQWHTVVHLDWCLRSDVTQCPIQILSGDQLLAEDCVPSRPCHAACSATKRSPLCAQSGIEQTPRLQSDTTRGHNQGTQPRVNQSWGLELVSSTLGLRPIIIRVLLLN